ncbi:MAG: MEDS domain-containing protein [Deltaproteobacteria bacterium]|nr:MEDS domain-containing protein [Deltaproteobacteria bacterium]
MNASSNPDKLRNSGISVIGDIEWGSHFCQFYKTKEDPYFKSGLDNNEFCMWVTSDPLNTDEARSELKKSVKNLQGFTDKGQLEIIPYSEWYIQNGRFESRRVLNGWVDKLNKASAKGFEGLRLTGNTLWLEKKDWRDFTDYEEAVNSVIGKYRMIALCTYSLERCGASEIIDVVNNHQFAIIKRDREWEIIESSEYKKAKEVLKRDKETLEKLIKEKTDALLNAHIELEKTKHLSDIGALSAIVAHELRNPLAAISLAAENIKIKAKNPGLEGFVSNIEKKVAESAQIISNLLYYSHIKPPAREDVNLASIIEECVSVTQKQSAKKVTINNELKNSENIYVKADPLQMREVFCNILNNAFDAVSDSDGKISITYDCENGFIKIFISDNGSGMDKEILQRAFEPFFTTKSKGTGLGLSVCRQIIDLHNGSIDIRSKEGSGTSLVLRLPQKS